MNARERLIRRAVEIQSIVKSARGALAKAMDEESLENVIALCQAITGQIARFVQDPAQFSMADYERVIAMQDQAQELLDRAIMGHSQPPLRGLAEGSVEPDEEPSPQSDFAVSIVPRRRKKGEDQEPLEVDDDTDVPASQDEKDDDEDHKARFPSQMGPLPKAAHPLAKSLSAQDERMRILYAEPDIADLLSPASRKRKGSAVMNVKGA